MPQRSKRIDYAVLALPKGERRSTAKGREDRREAAVVQIVRPQVVARDGDCRLLAVPQAQRVELFGACDGPPEWSHYNDTHRRSKTVGQAPERRHAVAHSLMLCRKHSQDYDQNRMRIKELTDRGCDGPLRVWRDGRGVWEEQA